MKYLYVYVSVKNNIYNKIEIYIKQEINEKKEALAKNKENKR